MADIIKVEHLSYVYNPGLPTAVTALDDVSFTVEEGDFVGIIGATGSGKSTLITHMNGLNKPTSGSTKNRHRERFRQRKFAEETLKIFAERNAGSLTIYFLI